jgi:hypothetical protein
MYRTVLDPRLRGGDMVTCILLECPKVHMVRPRTIGTNTLLA